MQGEVLTVDKKIQERMDSTFLASNGYIKLLPSEDFLNEDPLQLRVWCTRHALYGVPTVELIDWLRKEIGSQKAIEIGAGNARLGLQLGIISTDSYMQADPSMQLYYGSIGQAVTKPPGEVLRFEANEAVKYFKPEVVVASWVTQKFIVGKDLEGEAQASIHGVNEISLLKKVKRYIFIGNESSHGKKRILDKPHQTFKFPRLVSRARYPEQNVIYVWG